MKCRKIEKEKKYSSTCREQQENFEHSLTIIGIMKYIVVMYRNIIILEVAESKPTSQLVNLFTITAFVQAWRNLMLAVTHSIPHLPATPS